jgi:phosphonate transport system ATP-binding protein
MVFQHFNLVDRLSVMTNVLVGRLKHRSWLGSLLYLFRREDLTIAHEALDRVGLVDKCWERADKLSGGQQQRVGIARALAQRPKVILADEPVASLDPVSSEEIMCLLHEICRRDGITLLVNLHQVELARRFADRIVGLNDGKVVFDGSPAQLDKNALFKIYQREGQDHDEQLESVLAYA